MFEILQNTCLYRLELVVVSVTTLIAYVLFHKDSLLQLERIRPLVFAFASSCSDHISNLFPEDVFFSSFNPCLWSKETTKYSFALQ